ncbi:thioesterase family protein [Fuchsiella alkaliacetigena]|uniref:thioesterase family protein n=1 Tax=Fuchsiella alkaliacetigena TaxID=957042 RepID=UPI00200B4F0C|nr:thioesterase family protein [Fuchsiella alkaliacetigena]MCK8826058.1 thioesterase family protein [Fuchsiella alkaliacetigena]
MKKLEIGISGQATEKVSPENTAQKFESGFVNVYGTPAMIALVEKAASQAVQPFLEEKQTTVGTNLEVKHMAATPLNMEVKASVELIKIMGRRLAFKVVVEDEREKIGEGVHERFIVNKDKFHQRAQVKSKK